MPRPCVTMHPEPDPERCYLCRKYRDDPRYRALWGPDVRCRHLGPPTGEVRECRACGGGAALVALRGCAVWGACVPDRLLTGVPCCRVCERREEVTCEDQ